MKDALLTLPASAPATRLASLFSPLRFLLAVFVEAFILPSLGCHHFSPSAKGSQPTPPSPSAPIPHLTAIGTFLKLKSSDSDLLYSSSWTPNTYRIKAELLRWAFKPIRDLTCAYFPNLPSQHASCILVKRVCPKIPQGAKCLFISVWTTECSPPICWCFLANSELLFIFQNNARTPTSHRKPSRAGPDALSFCATAATPPYLTLHWCACPLPWTVSLFYWSLYTSN